MKMGDEGTEGIVKCREKIEGKIVRDSREQDSGGWKNVGKRRGSEKQVSIMFTRLNFFFRTLCLFSPPAPRLAIDFSVSGFCSVCVFLSGWRTP